ncbi:class I SAM-dependent methyltransferase [Pseudonocardia kunmingensis]|uniref:Methyltransferase family protein n=1 Tax=Pseudonocardia kunmingensis TaxID=630975 RepID=A0A543DWZ4_9PSEU|nr:class I SAM-dependent methyltransferase [Pseudonocardia kunmingensis]TQM13858.1 methyltransferase family protein [Pseudonocardia kunmingensis]
MSVNEAWNAAAAYERYIGRWSRRIAEPFVSSLDAPAGLHWLDVGCGTGALTTAVLRATQPTEVRGIDPSENFVRHARDRLTGTGAQFATGDARALPVPDARFDAVVSGLVLNFVPEPESAAAEMARVATPEGVVAAYVWDYADGMVMIRHFWDAATALDPGVADRAEGRRFPLCRPDPLRALWTGAGLTDVTVEAIEVVTVFRDFDDLWTPFLGGQGPAPGYVTTLDDDHRSALRDLLRERLPVAPDGSITLSARAWSVRGYRPENG